MAAFLLVPAAQASAEYTLTLGIAGTGPGEVVSPAKGAPYPGTPALSCSYAPPGPATGVCSNTLDESEEGFRLEALEAVEVLGGEFVGWAVEEGLGLENCEEPGSLECYVGTFEEGGNVKVTATFKYAPPLTALLESVEGGEGTVTSTPTGINCGLLCTASFPEGASVTLLATPTEQYGAEGSVFRSWKKCDKGGIDGRKCTVTNSVPKEVTARFARTYKLIAAKAEGSGPGKLNTAPGGILCLNNCSATSAQFLSGTLVTVKQQPAKHYHLTEWLGDCSGTGETCTLTMNEPHIAEALFEEDAKYALSLSKAGNGQGIVKSKPAGISCGFNCAGTESSYYEGETVELEVSSVGKGSTFAGWSGGGCSGTGVCKVTMNAAAEVTATFN